MLSDKGKSMNIYRITFALYIDSSSDMMICKMNQISLSK